ncbi:cid16 [Symbiodinium pilosum]|uniref:Cid16 protein n=1 Tax=Symbiodinium pilosum TaxID=2952 RepID=A0A812W6C3_SYMPI|nr:cid16 [Symbiodinium pilosum]
MSMSMKASSNPLGSMIGIQPSNNLLILLVLTAICIVVPLDLTQLIFACLGAFCYYVVQLLQRTVSLPASGTKKLKACTAPDSDSSSERPIREVRKPKRIPTTRKPGTHVDTQAQTPAVPIVAPKFEGHSLQEEVQELVSQIMPTAASQRGVDRLAEAIRVMLASSLPEVEVVGFASSDLSRGRANGVAVPDVDIVINVRPDRVSPKVASRPAKVSTDPRMLQKWALRHCADRLVSAGGFKFRRSGFRGNEPKMTLLVPSELGIFNQAVPIDIAVNAVSPLHSAALLTECGNISPRSKELILLIRRWAKDRGVCHAPKGHLSPYVWSLLAVYYLQVAERSEGALLPPVEEFEAIAHLLPDRGAKKTWQAKEEAMNVPVSQLLRGFMQFYNNFPWKQQAICVLKGVAGPAPLSLPINLIEHDDGKTVECGPNIEDPFAPKTNLGSSMTWWSFQRLREELARATSLLTEEHALEPELIALGFGLEIKRSLSSN